MKCGVVRLLIWHIHLHSDFLVILILMTHNGHGR
jgi:hypothetical protein